MYQNKDHHCTRVRARAVDCTAIVCAYNEERTLAAVVTALLAAPQVDEVIVIDDGSTDDTAGVLRRLGRHLWVRGFTLPENRGKGHAMALGIEQARGRQLLFVDADLMNFRPAYVRQLLAPLHSGEADMVIGWPKRGRGWLDALDPCRPLAGQRAMLRADVLSLVPLIRDSGFGVETLINLHFRREGRRVRYLPLQGLMHPVIGEKVGPWDALCHYAREGRHIFGAMLCHFPLLMAAYGPRPGGRLARLRRRLAR